MIVRDALSWARQRLIRRSAPDNSPEAAHADALTLLSHCLKQNKTWLFAHPESSLSENQDNEFRDLIKRRESGEPVAHLVGNRDFWSLNLKVSSHTLIPRPETELVVEAALDLTGPAKRRVLDLGTGTGAIALALAIERPEWEIIGTDISDEILSLARDNQAAHNIKNVRWAKGPWYDALTPEMSEKFDLIVSNPPYIREADPHLSQGDVRFEPGSALSSGPEGMDDLKIIVSESTRYLQPGGYLLVEHGYDQGETLREMFKLAGFSLIETLKDLAGHERVTLGRNN